MIVFSAGIRPRDELARQNALPVGARGGIAVNDHRTSDPTSTPSANARPGRTRLLRPGCPGYEMARVAAATPGQAGAAFTGADMSTKLKLMGVDVASIGDAQGQTHGQLPQFSATPTR